MLTCNKCLTTDFIQNHIYTYTVGYFFNYIKITYKNSIKLSIFFY